MESKTEEEPKNLHPREQPPSRRLIAVHPPLETGQKKWVITLMKDDLEWRNQFAPKLHVKAGLTRFYVGGGCIEPFATFPVSAIPEHCLCEQPFTRQESHGCRARTIRETCSRGTATLSEPPMTPRAAGPHPGHSAVQQLLIDDRSGL